MLATRVQYVHTGSKEFAENTTINITVFTGFNIQIEKERGK